MLAGKYSASCEEQSPAQAALYGSPELRSTSSSDAY